MSIPSQSPTPTPYHPHTHIPLMIPTTISVVRPSDVQNRSLSLSGGHSHSLSSRFIYHQGDCLSTRDYPQPLHHSWQRDSSSSTPSMEYVPPSRVYSFHQSSQPYRSLRNSPAHPHVRRRRQLPRPPKLVPDRYDENLEFPPAYSPVVEGRTSPESYCDSVSLMRAFSVDSPTRHQPLLDRTNPREDYWQSDQDSITNIDSRTSQLLPRLPDVQRNSQKPETIAPSEPRLADPHPSKDFDTGNLPLVTQQKTTHRPRMDRAGPSEAASSALQLELRPVCRRSFGSLLTRLFGSLFTPNPRRLKKPYRKSTLRRKSKTPERSCSLTYVPMNVEPWVETAEEESRGKLSRLSNL